MSSSRTSSGILQIKFAANGSDASSFSLAASDTNVEHVKFVVKKNDDDTKPPDTASTHISKAIIRVIQGLPNLKAVEFVCLEREIKLSFGTIQEVLTLRRYSLLRLELHSSFQGLLHEYKFLLASLSRLHNLNRFVFVEADLWRILDSTLRDSPSIVLNEMLSSIARLPRLNRVHISCSMVSPDGMEALCRVDPRSASRPALTLSLAETFILPRLCDAILGENSRVVDLALADIVMRWGFLELFDFVARSKVIRTFGIKDYGLTMQNAPELLKVLHKSSTLDTLMLSVNGSGGNSNAMISYIQNLRKLKDLRISFVGTTGTPEATQAVVSTLKGLYKNESLKEAHFQYSLTHQPPASSSELAKIQKVYEQQLADLDTGLQTNTTLTKLTIQRQGDFQPLKLGRITQSWLRMNEEGRFQNLMEDEFRYDKRAWTNALTVHKSDFRIAHYLMTLNPSVFFGNTAALNVTVKEKESQEMEPSMKRMKLDRGS